MMDKKTIIEDGILEQYILGELNANDCEQIEQLLTSDEELRYHLNALEKDFETIGMENAIEPPANIKNLLLENIRKSKPSDNKVVKITHSSFKNYFGIAASIAALLLVGSIYMYSQLNDVNKQLQTVEENNSELNTTIESLTLELDKTNQLYAAIAHPDTEQYILKGNDLMPDGKVVSYVNHNTKSVVINTERLPELDSDHDYQMWADVDGEMINMGVISKNQNLLAMNYIDDAESLNITIEPLGGNDHPTVERLVTNVYLR